VRSRHRRIVQAVQAGAWRQVKRLSSLVVHALAARAFAGKRVTEKAGKKTPGVEGERWNTPAQHAAAGRRLGRWRGYRPAPLKRLDIPKNNGTQRPLSIPPLADRARQAVSLPALQPMAETPGDRHAYGFRPTRRGADALDQGFQVLRQQTSATWIWAGEIQGFCANRRFAWLEAHLPRHQGVLSKWRRRGWIDRGTLVATTAGVPPGGMSSPVVSTMVWEGLDAGVHGGTWHRRVHHLNSVRGADDVIVTATSRQVFADPVLPRMNAVLAERGVRRSPRKTVITPSTQGFACRGQTRRTDARPNGHLGKLQLTPRRVSFQALKARVKARCQPAAGHPPAQRIATLNPVLRGWATDHRHGICGETCATLDTFVWRRLSRWAKRRHPNPTGDGIATRDVPQQPGASWRFTDPATGTRLIRVREVVKPHRHVQVTGAANPVDPAWEASFQARDRQLARPAAAGFRATVLRRHDGRCLVCRPGIPCEEALALPHREGDHQQNRGMH
jgi:RNA-directed DNA polymerase